MDNIKPFTLPNVISYTALLLSLTSILLILRGEFHLSLGTAFLAFLADTLDGYFARKLGQESEFGRQLDGFIDIFIYLIYPSLVYYLRFEMDDPISLVIIFIFILSGVFRLARFNIVGYVTSDRIKGYPGLPVFVSYFILMLIYISSLTIENPFYKPIALSTIFLQSFLMVKTFVFPKPKNIWPFVGILIILSVYMFYLGLT